MAIVPKLFRNSEELDRSLIYDLIAQKQEPSFTLMMPTHRTPPERETDPIRFKNLVSELEMKIKNAGLEKHLDLISKLHSVEKDRDFWNHQGAGLAVFIHPSYSDFAARRENAPFRGSGFYQQILISIKQRLQGGPDMVGHDFLPFRGRMDAI